jgi:hypothetical protein
LQAGSSSVSVTEVVGELGKQEGSGWLGRDDALEGEPSS